MTRKEAQRLVSICYAVRIGRNAYQMVLPGPDLTRYADPDRPGPVVSRGSQTIIRFL